VVTSYQSEVKAVSTQPKKAKSRVPRAEKADQRGRRIGVTVKDYERLSRRGSRHMAEALIARHNIRMKNLMRLPEVSTASEF
jgi:hypothetical protein